MNLLIFISWLVVQNLKLAENSVFTSRRSLSDFFRQRVTWEGKGKCDEFYSEKAEKEKAKLLPSDLSEKWSMESELLV